RVRPGARRATFAGSTSTVLRGQWVPPGTTALRCRPARPRVRFCGSLFAPRRSSVPGDLPTFERVEPEFRARACSYDPLACRTLDRARTTWGDPMTDPGIDAVERQIRQAQARGAFDDLPGAGEPLDLGRADGPDL